MQVFKNVFQEDNWGDITDNNLDRLRLHLVHFTQALHILSVFPGEGRGLNESLYMYDMY